jgi:carbamoyltransferase
LPPIRFYEHHRSHAAVAYFSSPFDRAAIATVDGRGGMFATVTWKAEGSKLTRMKAEPSTNSLGFFYRDTTNYLGLGQFSEGKAMGLASYGDPKALREKVDQLLDLNSDRWYVYRQQPSREILGFGPRTSEPLPSAPYSDLAAASQAVLENAVSRIATSAMSDADCKDLCLGGGVALNCSSNGGLLASGSSKDLFIFPATGDAGLSIGAAYLGAVECGELQREHLQSAAWGTSFTDAEYEAALIAEARVSYSRSSDLCEDVAEELAAGRVVGWFQGRMELGPRALGQRSIIADPRTVAMRDRVNRIKGREAWRPFAPMVLQERASEFLDPTTDSPFMLFAVKVRSEKRAAIPAVVHVDGTARPQTIAKARSPQLHRLISAFEQRTGVPIVLNTSFNLAHEPIVCTPDDAIKTFLASELDLLVLGDYVVRKRG